MEERQYGNMQKGRRGVQSSRIVTINDENGAPCTTPSEQHQHWRKHFSNVLNVTNEFNATELAKVHEREVDDILGITPNAREVIRALGKLKNGKASGSSDILPDMLKVGKNNTALVEMLIELFQTAWENEQVPQEWVDAILIPIPKKGNLHCCDNWRGIALLEVVGKAMARIIQSRLQGLAEKILPESQCGFRRGRSCTDMIFMIRQLVEKAIEHQAKQYIIFVDLRKAYDSVPREALWIILRKFRIAESLVTIIKSFHNNMQARIKVDGELLEEIQVENGLRQGCTLAPTLFNLYACAMAEKWTDRMDNAC